MAFVKAFNSSAAWIAFCLDLAQLYLTEKGAKSSRVFRHICDITPHGIRTHLLLCDVVCICSSRLFMSLSSSVIFFFLNTCDVKFHFTLTTQTVLARTHFLH